MTRVLQHQVYTLSGIKRNFPLDEANRRLWSIMAMAAKDIEAMCDEKGAEWSGEEH